MEGLLAQVRLRIGDQVLTAIITRDAVDELKLRRGDDALAIVKSTEVMIARQSHTTNAQVARPPRRGPKGGARASLTAERAMHYAQRQCSRLAIIRGVITPASGWPGKRSCA